MIAAPTHDEIFRGHGIESTGREDYLISAAGGRASLADASAGKGTDGCFEAALVPLGQENAVPGRSQPTTSR
jgi:hypothetical protein